MKCRPGQRMFPVAELPSLGKHLSSALEPPTCASGESGHAQMPQGIIAG